MRHIFSWFMQLWTIATLSTPCVHWRLASHYRPLNQVTIKCSGDTVSSLTVKTKGSSVLWKKKKKMPSFQGISVKKSRESGQIRGGDKDQRGKRAFASAAAQQLLCLRQAPNLWFKDSASYSRAKLACDGSLATIKSSFHPSNYSMMQVSLIKQLECRWPVCLGMQRMRLTIIAQLLWNNMFKRLCRTALSWNLITVKQVK